MSHPRTGIRNAVVAALIGTGPTYATAAGTRVFPTRMLPWKKPQLPAIAVYTLAEQVDPDSRREVPRLLNRILEVAVEVAAEAKSGVDASLDDICAQVELALDKDRYFGGLVIDSLLQSTDVDVRTEGDMEIAVARLVYTVNYDSRTPVADATADALKSADVHYNLNDTQAPADQAEDLVTGLDT